MYFLDTYKVLAVVCVCGLAGLDSEWWVSLPNPIPDSISYVEKAVCNGCETSRYCWWRRRRRRWNGWMESILHCVCMFNLPICEIKLQWFIKRISHAKNPYIDGMGREREYGGYSPIFLLIARVIGTWNEIVFCVQHNYLGALIESNGAEMVIEIALKLFCPQVASSWYNL